MSLFGPGTSLVVGTAGPDGRPRATRAWSSEVLDLDAGRLRILATADDPVVVANMAVGATVAITGADVRTLRSAQLKGRVCALEAPTEADLERMVVAGERFFEEILETDGTPIELTRRLLPHEVVAVEVLVTERYDQSPGPGAGAPIAGTT